MAVTVYRIFDCTDTAEEEECRQDWAAPADSPTALDTLMAVQQRQHCARSEGAD